ncbi:hypothetical protein [Catenuloplanes atrovinosus]|uniref:Uncharacterized protein n=1 Tax=Catenuloplanes atrovinosus TaxID=137266 RepID=A0AAE3YPW1_9ACTN|nr:hypothetical protein [Catenuloplanes atrovinosus]MDR7276406.1 hypothetical protein [Catenuloplanes atrovinosus]
MIERRGAWTLLGAYTLLWFGVAWDGQWHVDVGPDTFYTAPHLMFYAGSALLGFCSLAVVLLVTRRPEASAGTTVPVGPFRAPIAFLVTGLGAAAHLLYGATDLWWHEVYGFDILEETPSHFGLFLGMQLEIAGVVLAFLGLRGERSGRWGLAAAISLFVASAAIGVDGEPLGIPLNVLGLGAGTAWVVGMVVGAGLSARWLAAIGAAYVVLLGLTFLFPPWATRVYADAIDLRMRDNAPGIPIAALALPLLFPLIALLLAAAVRTARRRRLTPRVAMLAVGALTALTVVAQTVLMSSPSIATVLHLALTGAAGAGLCWVGWQNAALLRAARPEVAVA